VARSAKAAGLAPVLCGRDARKLAALSDALGLESRVAALSEPDQLDAALRDVAVVLNTAGPFSRTATPIVEACLRSGAHYLDITAENPAIAHVAARHAAARDRKVMLMPAVGFDVVPSDCLAAHVARRLPQARSLAMAVTELHFVTRGSIKTLFEAVDFGMVRRGGELVRVPLGALERAFDFGDGPEPAINVSLADLTTAYYTTGIADVATYVRATPLMRALLAACRSFGWLLGTAPAQAWLGAWAELLPGNPAFGVAAPRSMSIVVEAEDGGGRRVRSRLRTPEAYAFTGATAASIAERVLAGDLEPGFQTPARVYGSDFVLRCPGVEREDLD
jgi:short subunit dehydrogenase-like uncharacterized protein